jgi:hypothetical protein
LKKQQRNGCVAFQNGTPQVLIIDGGFLSLKNIITHLSSFQETWPNPSSFT